MHGKRKRGKVVIIGGGLGGIAAAITCATKGFQVELYEKNEKIGGKLNVKEMDGFSFDLGPSIIILPQYFRRLFTRAGKKMEDYVEFLELKPHWRNFFEDDVVLDLHPDEEVMNEELNNLGIEGKSYYEFMNYSKRLFNFAEQAYFEDGADTAMQIIRSHGIIKVVKGADFFRLMHDRVANHVKEKHMQLVLDFFIKYVGSSPYDAPASLNCLQYCQMGFGLYYVKGGMYNLAKAYQKCMEELGVAIHLGKEVKGIDKDGDRVSGIRLADGSSVSADIVVSNMEVIPAYKKLLREKRGKLMNRYDKKFEPAASGLVVHLGLKKRYPQLHHHNFFFSKDQEHFLDQIHHKKELPDDPTIYLVCPTRTNEALAPKGHEIIKILPHIPHVQNPPFSQADYDALKERVYDKLERMGLEGLRENTVVEDVLVPEDLERMYYSNKGAIYGVVSNRNLNLGLKAPKKSKIYENLYFVGGSVNPGGGTCMVVLSGQHVGDMIDRDFPK